MPRLLSVSGLDHPRVCGEKPAIGSVGVTVIGSPPRVRGEEIALYPERIDFRITPACAGRRSPLEAPQTAW